MQQLADWLNNPLVKSVLLFLGGLILKKWDKFVNAAIPMALLAVSIFLGLLRALWPDLVPAAHALVTQTNAVIPSAAEPWWKFVLVSVLLPVLIAVGTHSSGKNTLAYMGGDRVMVTPTTKAKK